MKDAVMYFCFGFSAGALVMWLHFICSRMIRTRREWYSDPVIAAKHPAAAAMELAPAWATCVCGHNKIQHDLQGNCKMPGCACGQGCIHDGFVDANQ
jgi:hypothetical protein